MKPKTLLMLLAVISIFIFAACETEKETEKEKTMKDKKAHATIAVLVAEGFHDGEAYMPMGFLQNQGYKVRVIGPEKGTVKAYNSDFTINIEKAVKDVNVDDFVALILPGGRGPAVLRENEEAVKFAKEFFESGKVTAAICHGPQVLITAGVMDGKTSTGFGNIQEELEEAGVTYVDESVVIDGNMITSRVPKDLYDFSKAIADAIKEQK